MDIALVGFGGALGSLARYAISKAVADKTKSSFPYGTFIINVLGAILLGLVTSINSGKSFYLLLGDGFFGAFTTFSTFMYEGFNLFQDNKKLNAFIYIFSTFILGIAGFIAGFEIAKLLKIL